MSFIIAAPASGSGKTTITLGLLRALSRAGTGVRGAKSGPDYIDPRFHAAACGQPCLNLDAWAMSPERLQALATGAPLIVEGAMGLFDGAPPNGKGATADLARLFGWPVVLVVDASRMAQSIAPLVAGFVAHDPDVRIAGVILNKVGSDRHAQMLCDALEPSGIKVCGCVPRTQDLSQPSRHLGLVQASEHPALETYLDGAADLVARHIAINDLPELVAPSFTQPGPRTAPPAQRIAVAKDTAFAFAYPHLLSDWQSQGAIVQTFSPLADEICPEADLIVLPGGYPELHAGRLAANTRFLNSLRDHARSKPVYGECGGYMVLGETLTDADGKVHKMAGLLSLATSFAERKLHLGYRQVQAAHGPFTGTWTAHEFHYATTVKANGEPLFTATDAEGTPLPPMGLRHGNVAGSFAHLIDCMGTHL